MREIYRLLVPHSMNGLKLDRCIQAPSMSLLRTTKQASLCAAIANTDGSSMTKDTCMHAREDKRAKANACWTAARLQD